MSSSLSARDPLARIAAEHRLGSDVAPAALQALLRILDADGGRIYTLDLGTGCYTSVAHDQRSREFASIDARAVRDVTRPQGPLEHVIATAQPFVLNSRSEWPTQDGIRVYGARAIFPILRGRTVVGLVDLHSDRPGAFQDWQGRRLAEATTAMQPLANAQEGRTLSRILERTAEFRVTLFAGEQQEVANLMNWVGESSAMQYAILRRCDGPDHLTCIATYGFRAGLDPAKLSLSNLRDRYRPFSVVVAERTHWIAADMHSEIYAEIRKNHELDDLQSFVACPILVGETLWGVLSFSAAVEYEYSDLEAFALRALANLAGAAFTAARSAEDAAATRFDDGQLMQAVLSNEVIVATRHELADQLEIIGNARSALYEVVRPLRDPKRSTRLARKDVDDLLFEAEALDSAHGEINKILDTIRLSQRELTTERNKVLVKTAWDSAVAPFVYRMRRSNVTRIDDSGVPDKLAITGSFDWLRIVFMQLVLNSLDAFDRNFEKGRREVILRVESVTDERVTLRYIDNAGGIINGTLMRRRETVSGEIPRLIFERYVTSKERGTGLGLASCRAALATMDGSIDLIDWHRGVTFEIALPAWDD